MATLPASPVPDTDPLVRVRDLRVSFRLDKHTTFEAVKGISFDIPHNATVALVGESGSGKSVTSLAILGLLPPENTIVDPRSQIQFGGRNLAGMSRNALQSVRGADISMIFQEPMTSLNPVFTVGFQIEEVLRLHTGLSGSKARKRAIEVLGAQGPSVDILLDDSGFPVKAARFELELAGGHRLTGTLDDNGRARVDGISPGGGRVRFPDLADPVWGKVVS